MTRKLSNYTLPLLILNLASAPCALAQVSELPAKPAAKDEVVQEVIITSQRRSVKMQDTPISATVLTGDQLKDKSVTRMSDLVAAAPALQVTEGGMVASMNIRGIGLASGSPQVANGVATYIDGLFQPPIVGAGSFYDIANVEVLRGPQGTLVGSNSTGGAVLITTQNPKLGGTAVSGYVEAGIGNASAKSLQGALNVPMSNTLALRIAANKRARDSFYTDHGPYRNTPGSLDENDARVSVLWKPGKFQALLKSDYLDKKNGGFAYKPIPGSANDVGVTGGPYELNYNSPTRFNEHALMNSLELRYETESGIVLRSLTGVQSKYVDMLTDVDATARASNFNDQFVRERQWSQEFNIISPTGGRFNWIVGAYYQRNKIDVNLHQTGGPVPVDVEVHNDKRTTGFFVQTGYKLTETLELQAGARASAFSASGDGGVYIGRGIPVFPPQGLLVADPGGTYSDNMPTGKIALNWKVDPRNLVYGFVARGYKPGNFASRTTSFGPESVLNYELGWKTGSADGRVRAQLDVFYNNYHNFQLDVLNTVTGQNDPINLPPSTVKGIEGSIQARLAGFRLDAGLAYVKSTMGAATLIDTIGLPAGLLGPQCGAGVASNPPVCFNYIPYSNTSAGGPNLYSPKLTYNAGIDYQFNLPSDMTLTPRLNLVHAGPSYFYATYRPNVYMPGHTTLSGLVTLRADEWTAELYGNNLSNKAYIVGSTNSNLFYNTPREYGIRVSKEF